MSDTTILVEHLGATQTDVGEFEPHVVKLDNGLRSVTKALEEVKDISDNLSTLDKDLKTIGEVLLVLQAVPVVGQACGVAKNAVNELEQGVHPVRTKANEFEARVKPVRDKLEAVEEKVALAIEKLDQLKQKAGQLREKADTVYTCALSKNLTSVVSAEDQFSAGLNPAVTQLNKALTRATGIAQTVEDKVTSIEDAATKMVSIARPLHDLRSQLRVLSEALKPIQSALEQKITIPYSVKVAVTGWNPFAWHWGTRNFTFSVQQILTGIDTTFKAVNDALLAAARQILSRLHVNLPTLPSIPGLDELRQALHDALGPISSIGDDLDNLKGEFDVTFSALEQIGVGLDDFSFEC